MFLHSEGVRFGARATGSSALGHAPAQHQRHGRGDADRLPRRLRGLLIAAATIAFFAAITSLDLDGAGPPRLEEGRVCDGEPHQRRQLARQRRCSLGLSLQGTNLEEVDEGGLGGVLHGAATRRVQAKVPVHDCRELASTPSIHQKPVMVQGHGLRLVSAVWLRAFDVDVSPVGLVSMVRGLVRRVRQ